MTGPCFVGAEVFVYARDPRDAAKQSRALHWIAHLWQERLGRTSVQALSEYYVLGESLDAGAPEALLPQMRNPVERARLLRRVPGVARVDEDLSADEAGAGHAAPRAWDRPGAAR